VEAAGLPLHYREFAGGHNVDPRLLGDLATWLVARLP
jgi:predicted esterase